VRIRYTTLDAKPATIELTGFLATVFQHEIDHLDGKLYIDRITDTTLLTFEEEFARYLAPQEETEVLD
jgi:peptide deformylase